MKNTISPGMRRGHRVTANETNADVDVYFDDVEIMQVHSEILATYDYYPFGLTFDDPVQQVAQPKNFYLYNGKELQEETEWYDFGARMYDPVIGRFPSVDPIIERFPYLTPYNYASNNPVTNIDLWGLQGTNANYALWASNNPFGAIADGFRQIFDAALSLFTVTGEVYTNAKRTQTKVTTGNTTISVSAETKTSAFIKMDFSGIMDANSNNEVILPNNMVEVGVKTTQSVIESAKTTVTVNGVPVNATVSSTQNTTDESITKSAEVSVGVDRGNVQGNVFINASSTTNSDGDETNKASIGIKVQVPVYQDEKNTISIGTQLKLEHELH